MGKENSCISNDCFLVKPNIKKCVVASVQEINLTGNKKMRSCKCAGNKFDWK